MQKLSTLSSDGYRDHVNAAPSHDVHPIAEISDTYHEALMVRAVTERNVGNFQVLPDNLIVQLAVPLPANTLSNLRISNRYLSALLTPDILSNAMASEDVVRTSAKTEMDFLTAANAYINSYKLPSPLTPASIRADALTLPYVDGLVDSEVSVRHRGYIYLHVLSGAVKAAKRCIELPLQSLRATLDLIDLEAAEYAGTDSFSHGESNPYHLFTNTNPLFLPAMLESLVTTVPAAGLVFELSIFCRRFDGTLDAVSDTLAGMLAAELFFNGPLPPRIHPHAKGPAVREIMHRRFGVSSEAQWKAVDRDIASGIYRRLDPIVPRIEQLCQHWRLHDASFRKLVEDILLAERPILYKKFIESR
ncbi:hypothetical protein [Robbsia andropogonis]|nr:hypothetical protein [Robbsia andropogonis]